MPNDSGEQADTWSNIGIEIASDDVNCSTAELKNAIGQWMQIVTQSVPIWFADGSFKTE